VLAGSMLVYVMLLAGSVTNWVVTIVDAGWTDTDVLVAVTV
jgi:hypothetical protein